MPSEIITVINAVSRWENWGGHTVCRSAKLLSPKPGKTPRQVFIYLLYFIFSFTTISATVLSSTVVLSPVDSKL